MTGAYSYLNFLFHKKINNSFDSPKIHLLSFCNTSCIFRSLSIVIFSDHWMCGNIVEECTRKQQNEYHSCLCMRIQVFGHFDTGFVTSVFLRCILLAKYKFCHVLSLIFWYLFAFFCVQRN